MTSTRLGKPIPFSTMHSLRSKLSTDTSFVRLTVRMGVLINLNQYNMRDYNRLFLNINDNLSKSRFMKF